LIGGGPALFLDNLNNTSFKSNLPASAITERPASVRILGESQMVPLNASSFVILTGNALTVSEDLARRFIEVVFDAGTEDPEERSFPVDIKAAVARRTKPCVSRRRRGPRPRALLRQRHSFFENGSLRREAVP
jgi:hypothetical protein